MTGSTYAPPTFKQTPPIRALRRWSSRGTAFYESAADRAAVNRGVIHGVIISLVLWLMIYLLM